MLDLGVGNSKQPIGMDATGGDPTARYPIGRKLIDVGQTPLSNADIFDNTKGGAGIATDVVSDPAGPFNGVYTEGTGGCMVFVQKMLGRLSLPNPSNALFDTWVKLYQDYILQHGPQSSRLIVSSRQVTTWGETSDNDVTEYRITGHNQLTPASQAQPQGTNALFQDDDALQPIASPWDEQLPSAVMSADGHTIRSPFDNADDLCKRSLNATLKPRCGSTGTSSDGFTEVALVRVNGIVSTVALVTEATAQAAGVAAAAIAAAFVILDFVNGNWVGGAFGAAVSLTLHMRFGSILNKSGSRPWHSCCGFGRWTNWLDRRWAHRCAFCHSPGPFHGWHQHAAGEQHDPDYSIQDVWRCPSYVSVHYADERFLC